MLQFYVGIRMVYKKIPGRNYPVTRYSLKPITDAIPSRIYLL